MNMLGDDQDPGDEDPGAAIKRHWFPVFRPLNSGQHAHPGAYGVPFGTRDDARTRFEVYDQIVQSDPVLRAEVERAVALVTGQLTSLDEERTLDEIYEDAAHEAALDDGIFDVITGADQ